MNLSELTPAELSAMIDYSFLRPYGTGKEIEKLCLEADAYGFATVAVNPAEAELCAQLLSASSVGICVAIGFPLGQNTPAVKDYEVRDAIARGANELDMVINVRALQDGNLALVRGEIASLVEATKQSSVVSKVILETCYLSRSEIEIVCKLATDCGVDFVKTSTGFGTAGADVDTVRFMRDSIGPNVGVKASGGIHNLDIVLSLINAGANRIGASKAVSIVEDLKERRK